MADYLQEFIEEDWNNSLTDLQGVLCSKYIPDHPAC